jgi:hypothetical protein
VLDTNMLAIVADVSQRNEWLVSKREFNRVVAVDIMGHTWPPQIFAL